MPNAFEVQAYSQATALLQANIIPRFERLVRRLSEVFPQIYARTPQLSRKAFQLAGLAETML